MIGEPAVKVLGRFAGSRDGDVHGADRFVGGSATGAGNSRHRDGNVAIRAVKRAFCQSTSHVLADGALSRDQICRNPDELGFRFVRISDADPVNCGR